MFFFPEKYVDALYRNTAFLCHGRIWLWPFDLKFFMKRIFTRKSHWVYPWHWRPRFRWIACSSDHAIESPSVRSNLDKSNLKIEMQLYLFFFWKTTKYLLINDALVLLDKSSRIGPEMQLESDDSEPSFDLTRTTFSWYAQLRIPRTISWDFLRITRVGSLLKFADWR